jgi:hypothetical protein
LVASINFYYLLIIATLLVFCKEGCSKRNTKFNNKSLPLYVFGLIIFKEGLITYHNSF